MFKNDVLHNILKPPLPPQELFLWGFNALEITFLQISTFAWNFFPNNIIDLVNIFSKYVPLNE